MHLENEVRQKRDEVQTLREQVRVDVTGKSFHLWSFVNCVWDSLQLNRARTDRPASASMRRDLNERISEVNSLRGDLERMRKDKNITAGLVSQMQRDMTNKVRVRG